MKKLTFSQKEVADKSHAVVLFRGYSAEDERRFYVYLHATFSKLLEMKNDIMLRKDLDMKKYGVVLEWGYDDPTVEVMQLMRDKYGFKHDSGMIIDGGPSAADRGEIPDYGVPPESE